MASWAAVETEDYPRFLKRAGLRIATFTKLLSRYSNILIRDFNVAPTIRVRLIFARGFIAFNKQLQNNSDSMVQLLSANRSPPFNRCPLFLSVPLFCPFLSLFPSLSFPSFPVVLLSVVVGVPYFKLPSDHSDVYVRIH